MPIQCPVCSGRATNEGGTKKKSEFVSRVTFTCKKCGAKIPAHVTIEIEYESIKRSG